MAFGFRIVRRTLIRISHGVFSSLAPIKKQNEKWYQLLSIFSLFCSVNFITFKPTTNDLREVCKMGKTCEMRKTCEKKGMHDITQNLTTHVSRYYYFLIQLNYILHRTRKSFCLKHNYRFYHKMVRDTRHEKSVWSWLRTTHETVANMFRGSLARKHYAARELPAYMSQFILFSH